MSQVHPQLEKVARAMVVEDGLNPDEEIIGGQASGFQNYGPLWQAEQFSEGQLGITDYLGLARAAVRALMDPDEGMVLEGREHHPFCAGDPVGAFDETKAAYRAMLAPLLGENA